MSELTQDEKRDIALALFGAKCVLFGDFTLASGQRSRYYLDLRRLQSFPLYLETVAMGLAVASEGLEIDRFSGIPEAAGPMATALSLRVGIGTITLRKEQKDHGAGGQIMGYYEKGMRVCAVDDVITTGASKLKTIEPFTEAGLEIVRFQVVVDRQQGGLAQVAEAGYEADALLTVSEAMEVYRENDLISPDQYKIVADYLEQEAARLEKEAKILAERQSGGG